MNFAKTSCILLAILISAALALPIAFSAAIPFTIDNVKVNGDSLSPSDVNKLSIERGDEIEIKVILTASQATDNVQVEAQITGYEHSDEISLSGKTKVFNAYSNTTYTKKIYITLPEDVEEDSYKLRITVANRNDDEITQNYNLKIDAPRHSIAVNDIMLMPGSSVEAGKPLLVSLRVENMGNRDEDSVKATASIPSLGISASDYIDEIEEGDAETSEQLFLMIPECAEPGAYQVVAEVEYNDGKDSSSESASIMVNEGSSCKPEEEIEEPEEDEEEADDEDAYADANYSVPANSTAADASASEDAGQARTEMLRTALEISLIVLIIALVAVGIIAGFVGITAKQN